jgi:hypothetical protein
MTDTVREELIELCDDELDAVAAGTYNSYYKPSYTPYTKSYTPSYTTKPYCYKPTYT